MFTRNNITLNTMNSNIYCFDLDGTLCTKVDNSDYTKAKPFTKAIQCVNTLYENGKKIIIFTGRGSFSKKDWTDFTKKQIDEWGLKYHELITNKKPIYDLFIDDKAINADDWRNQNCGSRGVLAGAFDLIHPGYIKMFQEAKTHCDHLTVLLHENPSLENKKQNPIHTIKERKEILSSIKYIDEILTYKFEKELTKLLCSQNFDIRFLGDDYKFKQYTGQECTMKTIFINRDHGYSTTKLKQKIKDII